MAAPASAREVAYQTLWGRIVTMELKPGDPLNDRQLAEEMGISRTPVREALIMLNIAHMVTIKPQSGTYVAPMDLKLMRLEQFARFTLEKEMLTHVCKHCRPEHLAAYRTNIQEYQAAGAAPNTPLKTSHMLRSTTGSTGWPSSFAAWKSTSTICCPPSSTSSGCACSA